MTDYVTYFDALYAKNSDPWNYAKSEYERLKYDATCSALRSTHYLSGIELGCSVGVLSARLAPLCDRFLAVDIAGKAVDQAATKLANIPGASASVRQMPAQWPEDQFDLIMLSEVIYYFTPFELQELARKIAACALPSAECVLVNWHGPTDTCLTGTEARATFCTALATISSFATIQHAGTDEYDHVTLILD